MWRYVEVICEYLWMKDWCANQSWTLGIGKDLMGLRFPFDPLTKFRNCELTDHVTIAIYWILYHFFLQHHGSMLFNGNSMPSKTRTFPLNIWVPFHLIGSAHNESHNTIWLYIYVLLKLIQFYLVLNIWISFSCLQWQPDLVPLVSVTSNSVYQINIWINVD